MTQQHKTVGHLQEDVQEGLACQKAGWLTFAGNNTGSRSVEHAGQHAAQSQTDLLQLGAPSNGAVCLGHQALQAGQDGLQAAVRRGRSQGTQMCTYVLGLCFKRVHRHGKCGWAETLGTSQAKCQMKQASMH